jgi:hypothetical protein
MRAFTVLGVVILASLCRAEDRELSRCRVVPQANHEVVFLVDGGERLRWHCGRDVPRPFFFPLVGPSGSPLTRMGHPGAPDHEHHRSIWFAHHAVNGVDFWGDRTSARVRQEQWLVYEDGRDAARMAVLLGWHPEPDAKAIMEQELVVEVRAADDGETLVELQSTFRAPKGRTVTLGKTNFGFLAVRVAKSISGHFGGGTITSSGGATGEKAVFGQEARWMDYSGPVPNRSQGGAAVMNGITYHDHPANPGYPSRWHVREDGWMGASVCRTGERTIESGKPLVLRYLIHAHAGPVDAANCEKVAAAFAQRPPFEVVKSRKPHRAFELRRVEE